MKKYLIYVIFLKLFFNSYLYSDTWLFQLINNAEAKAGYDRFISLNPDIKYIGGFSISDGKNVIYGNGAVIDLQGDNIQIGNNAELELYDCVIINGNKALYFLGNSSGIIRNCVLAKNNKAINYYSESEKELKITNSIIAYNVYGVYKKKNTLIYLAYNNMFNNQNGNYIELCPS